MKMIIKIKRFIFILATFYLFFVFSNISTACEYEFHIGVTDDVCTGQYGRGRTCGEVYIPKPSQSSDRTRIFDGLGYVYESWILSNLCRYLTTCPTQSGGNKIIGSVKTYLKEEFKPGIIYGTNIDEHYMAIYIGPNCNEIARGSRETRWMPVEIGSRTYDGIKYIPECKGKTIDRAFCTEGTLPGYLPVKWVPIFEDCTKNYKGQCSASCGGDNGCIGAYPKSIGYCDEYGMVPCLCNEECKAEKVDWKDVFKVTYTINGIPIEVKESTSYGVAQNEKLNIKVKVDVSDKFKDKFIPHDEKVGIAIDGGCRNKKVLGEYNIGDEIPIDIKAPEYYEAMYEISIIPAIIRKTYVGKNARKLEIGLHQFQCQWMHIDLPLPSLTIEFSRNPPCSQVKIGNKNFTILLNGTLLYDPDLEVWNKCCRDNIISIEKIEEKQISEEKESGVIMKFKIKDNRDPICEDLFGKWILDIHRKGEASVNQLKTGENEFQLKTTIYPKVWIFAVCGNGVCELGRESCYTCPQDCGPC